MVDNTPFFIVGSSRSGTTLLRLILAGHSRMHIPPETWFILPLVARFSLTGTLTPEEVKEAVKIITSHRRWRDMEIANEELIGRVQQEAKLVDIINAVYAVHLDRSRKVR